MRKTNYWLDGRGQRSRLSRRGLLKGATLGSLGAAGLFVVGCGDDDDAGNGDASPGSSTTPGATPGASGPRFGGDLVVVPDSSEPVMDPALSRTGYDPQFHWTVFDNLVANDAEGLPDEAASLAEGWEVVDGTQFVFTLRQGVTFHDGTPLNAEAVKFNFDRVLDPETNSQYRAQLGADTQVSAPDEYTVVLDLAEPDAALLAQLGDRAGMIGSPTAIMASEDDYGQSPTGSGPFIFDTWVPGSHMIMRRNPEYWRQDAEGNVLPYLDSIRFNFIEDGTVALANLESGSAHIVAVSPIDYERISASGDYKVTTTMGYGSYGSYLNNSVAPMDDIHFRRAVAYAIDKAAVNSAMTHGQGQEAIGPIGPTSWAFNPDIEGYPYGLEAAREELAKSKYPDGADLPAVTFNTPDYQQEVDLWTQMLRPLNINLTAESASTAEIVERMFVDRDVPLFVAGHSQRPDPSGVITDNLSSEGFYNSGGQTHQEMDDAIASARQTYDVEERKAYYDVVQKIAIDEVWQFIYTLYRPLHMGSLASVRNIDGFFTTDGKPRFQDLWLES